MSFALRWRLGILVCLLLPLASVTGCVPAASDVGEAASPAQAPVSSETNPGSPLSEEVPETSPMNRQLIAQGQILPVTAEVQLGDQIIGLEVAQTPQQQAIGLMARASLADDRGMLFPFEPARPVSFWMKNVLIPLDMVFVYNGEIVAIASNVPPCETNPCPTYGPGQQAIDYVIELRGGLAEELGIEAGDPVEIEWLETSAETES